ncbi:trypco2 family protein [Nocardiopsis akebiae]|uniref:trypco2 family protein n=1 Tax=Nocardiopsis akebiae TaxID=2831968 RepID=UPI00211203E2|nr:trypco2 family protein [Nocardiopsis akebiae]
MPATGLPQAIDELRREVAAARRRGEPRDRRRDRRDRGRTPPGGAPGGAGRAGVRFGVLSLDAEGKAGRRDTHRITLKLAPTDADGRKLAIASESGAVREDRRDLD